MITFRIRRASSKAIQKFVVVNWIKLNCLKCNCSEDVDNVEVNNMFEHSRMPTDVFIFQSYLFCVHFKELLKVQVLRSDCFEVKVLR